MRLTDQTGYDLLEGLGANRSRTAVEQVPILYASTSVHVPVTEADVLTLILDNHFALSAQIEIALYYERLGI